MREYIIPQEFNQSDRIGKFTIPQALILGGGIVIILLMMATMNFFVALVLSAPIGALMAYLMFKKVNEIPVYEFALVYIVYRSMPKQYIYRADNIKDEFVDDLDVDIFE